MADAAKIAPGQEIRKLLVRHRKRRMDQEQRLAHRGRLAKTASVDRPQKNLSLRRNACSIPRRSRQNLPRRLSTPEIHFTPVGPTRYNTCRKAFGPAAELGAALGLGRK